MNAERSKALYERAKALMPGGVSSPVRAVQPYPLYIVKGEGGRVRDADDNSFIDLVLGFGPLILGHAHPMVVHALQAQAADGTLYGAPHENEILLAKMVRKHVPSMEMMRFVSSGTEATMHALRLARGFTGRNKVIKMNGGFHGAHDSMLVRSGSGTLTHGAPDSLGVPEETARNTLVVEFNDPQGLRSALDANRGQVAAVIMEPMLGNVGPVPPAPGYLETVRELTRKHGSLLIFDEVITGFRLSLGGAQSFYDVCPDLTVLGKVLGGGMPMGAFGGPKEIMSLVSPLGKVYQAGTFSGNPMSLAAGLTTLQVLEKEGLDKLNAKGEVIRRSFTQIAAEKGAQAEVQGEGSIFQIFFGKGPFDNTSRVMECDKGKYMTFYRSMLEHGVYMPPSQFESCFLCTAHTYQDLDAIKMAFAECLEGLS